MRRKTYYTYILTNKRHTVLYIGMTNDLMRRIWQHKHKVNEGFTKRYNVDQLVYFEEYDRVVDAISREKQLKGWVRRKKEALISEFNPSWKDLYQDFIKP